MSDSSKPYYQHHYDTARAKRLEAELVARQTRSATILPEFSLHATCAVSFRKGWNSVTLQDIEDYIRTKERREQPQRINLANLSKARKLLGDRA